MSLRRRSQKARLSWEKFKGDRLIHLLIRHAVFTRRRGRGCLVRLSNTRPFPGLTPSRHQRVGNWSEIRLIIAYPPERLSPNVRPAKRAAPQVTGAFSVLQRY